MNIIPGPGDYKIDKTDIIKKNKPKYSFGKSQRSLSLFIDELDISAIGPGHYELDSGFSQVLPNSPSVKWDKSERFEDIKLTPGPGDYENKRITIKTRSPKFSFTKLARKDIWNLQVKKPITANYNLKEPVEKGYNVIIFFKYNRWCQKRKIFQ